MKEIYESFKQAVKERLGSPFIGTYCIFWLILNWQVPVLILKSALPIEKTIDDIYGIRLGYWRGLIIPALLTVLFLVVYPWVALYAEAYADWVNIRRVKRKCAYEAGVLKEQEQLFVMQTNTELWKAQRAHDAENTREEAAKRKEEAREAIDHEKEKRKIDRELALVRYRYEKNTQLRAQLNLDPNVDIKKLPGMQ